MNAPESTTHATEDDPDVASFLAAMDRFRAVGMVEVVKHDAATGDGEVWLTDAGRALFEAGRTPFDAPAFVRAWIDDDVESARRWIELAADVIRENPALADEFWADDEFWIIDAIEIDEDVEE